MTSLSLRSAAVAACLGAVACSEELLTLAEGSPSTLSVRAYVDADGDGAFDAATDVPAPGLDVTATGPGGAVTQTTDASGLATFQLAPGSYSLAVAGTAPAGAVLATASSPIVVAEFQGGEVAAEFRYAYLPGALSVVVFRDDDASGDFDPAQDTPAPGIAAALTVGTDTVAEGTTASDGSLLLETIRPGDYTLTFTPFPTITLVDGDAQAVTVTAGQTTDVGVEFTGNLVVSIAEARASSGTTVAVEGVVTWQQPWDSRVYYFQDATGGVGTFDFGNIPVARGDLIRVIGTVGVFRGEVQLSPVSNRSILQAGTAPTARTVSAQEINAGMFQGELVTLTGTVDSVKIDGFDNASVYLSDSSGDDFLVFNDERNGVAPTAFTVGAEYQMTGVLTTDDRFVPDIPAARLETRDAQDIVLGGPPVQTIADAKTQPAMTAVTVEGVVTVAQFTYRTQGDNAYIQDNTSGIQVFDLDPALALVVGDSVRVTGVMGAFAGELEILEIDPTTPPIVIDLGAGTVPAPRVVTVAEIIARTYEGELVTISDVTVTAVGGTSPAYNVTLENASAESFTLRIDTGVGASVPSSMWTVGNMYTVVGALGSFNGAAQLKPRGPADITQQ